MNWLKAIRTERKLTGENIAFVTGISRSAYSNIENGKRRPSPEVAKKIAETLGFNWTRFYENGDEFPDTDSGE